MPFRQFRRRLLLAHLGGGIVFPHVLRAQQVPRRPIIGFLGPSTPLVARERVAVFAERLGQRGWIIGQNVDMEYRWANGNTKRFDELATDLARLKVDVIATWGTETAVAAQKATSTIPIVFTIVGDPVGSGLVSSLARPGGNVTGLSTQHDDTAGKRIAFLREVVPTLSRLAVLGNVGNLATFLDIRAAEKGARALGLDVIVVEARQSEDFESGIEGLQGRADGLYVAGDALVNTNRDRINALSLKARLPTVHGFEEIVKAGGLMSYGPDYMDLFRKAADYVNKILRGAKPAGLPVEQPSKFELVINLKTAKALAVHVPDRLLSLADNVIE